MKGFLLLYMTRINLKNPHYVKEISEAFDLRDNQAQMTVAALSSNSHSLILTTSFHDYVDNSSITTHWPIT